MLPGRAEHGARPLRAGERGADELIPLARPRRSASARRSWCSRRCAPGGCRWGRGCPSSSARFGGRLGAEHVVRRLQRHRRPAPGHPRRRDRARATRWSPRRSASSRRPTACSTRARSPSSATSTRATLNIDPRGGRRGGHRAHDRPAARAHLRLPGRHARASSAGRRARAVARRGRLRGARRRPRRRRAGRRARQPAVFGFYPNKQLTTGEGGAVVCPDADDQGSGSTASATRAARPTWAGSTTTGWASTTGSPTSPARSGWPSSSGSTRCWPTVRAWRRSTARRWPGSRASSCPAPTTGGDRRSWFVYVVQLPRGRRPRRRDRGAARARRRLEAVPAGDPPDELLPRALRPPRGRVPRLRGRRRAARSRCRSSPSSPRARSRAWPRPWASVLERQLLQQPRHADPAAR